MYKILNQTAAIVLIFTCFVAFVSAEGLVCNSCGEECADACGTRFFRTCCFNYLRKRSLPPNPTQMLNVDDENIRMSKAELERLIRNELMREQNINHLDLNLKSHTKEDFQKSAPMSNSNQIRNDQMHVIYEN